MNNYKDHISQEGINLLKIMREPMKSSRLDAALEFSTNKGNAIRDSLKRYGFIATEGKTTAQLYLRTKREIPDAPYTLWNERDIDPIDLDYPHWPVPASTLQRQADRYPSFRG